MKKTVGICAKGTIVATLMLGVLFVVSFFSLSVKEIYAEGDKCYKSGKKSEMDGIFVCDCTQTTNGGDCMCIIAGPCPPANQEAASW